MDQIILDNRFLDIWLRSGSVDGPGGSDLVQVVKDVGVEVYSILLGGVCGDEAGVGLFSVVGLGFVCGGDGGCGADGLGCDVGHADRAPSVARGFVD